MFILAKMWKQFISSIANLLSIKFREFLGVFLGKFFAKGKIVLVLAKVFAIYLCFHFLLSIVVGIAKIYFLKGTVKWQGRGDHRRGI
jgi:hypothetical protein